MKTRNCVLVRHAKSFIAAPGYYGLLAACLWAVQAVAGDAKTGLATPAVVAYPAPKGVEASGDYTVEVNGKPVFVYIAQVEKGGPASYAYFDFAGTVEVKVKVKSGAASAAIRPTSYGIAGTVAGDVVSFSLSQPRNLSIEPNGRPERPLLLFANPIETDPPKPGDSNVVYFGPGLHELGGTTKLTDNMTLYIAGGAVVRARVLPDEKPTVERNWAGNKQYKELIVAQGARNVTVRGRGILDCSLLPWHAKCPIWLVNCRDFLVEGIIVVDSPSWNMPCHGCRGGRYERVKQIAHRENSDGINICNSQDITVEGCFLRNNDDEICIKTTEPPPALEGRNITVRDCVIWNDRALALGITYETRANVTNVLFKDCDIIHDTGIAALTIHVSDSGTMSGIRFEDIRVEETRSLMRLWIGGDMWGKDQKRGHIRDVTYRNVSFTGSGTPSSEISGAGPENLVEDVTFDHLRVNGKLVNNAAEGRFSVQNTRNIRFVTASEPAAAAPEITQARAVAEGRVELVWPAVEDPAGPIRFYAVYRDGAKIGESAVTSYRDAEVRHETAYTYCVAAVNGSLREGPKSKPVKVTALADTTPPTVESVWMVPVVVVVVFSEPLERGSAETAANYAVDRGLTVTKAVLAADGRTVTLTMDKPGGEGMYALRVSNVRDAAKRPNTIAAGSRAVFSSVPGLVGQWVMNEGAGGAVKDSSGHGNDGAFRGQPAWVSGEGGRGVRIEPGSYLEVPHSDSLDTVQAGDYTLCVWYTPLSLPQGTESGPAFHGLLMKEGYHLGLTYSSGKKFNMHHWLQGNQGAGVGSAGTFEAGKTYHVAGVVDRAAGIVRLYVNGKLEGEGRFPANASAHAYGGAPWRMGIANPGASSYRWPAHGVLGGAQIYKVALSSNEVQSLARTGGDL